MNDTSVNFFNKIEQQAMVGIESNNKTFFSNQLRVNANLYLFANILLNAPKKKKLQNCVHIKRILQTLFKHGNFYQFKL